MKYIKHRFSSENNKKTTFRKYFPLCGFNILLTFFLICGSVFSGILEEATALYESGEHVKAGEKLSSELSKVDPSMPAVSLGIDIALASGELMQASILSATLFRVSVTKDMNMVYKSAKTADMLGEKKLARTRYLSWLAKTRKDDERFRNAARYLFDIGVYPEVLARYLNAFGSEGARDFYTDDLISTQIDKSMRELFSSNDVDGAIELFELSLSYYQEAPSKLDNMLLILHNNLKFVSKSEQISKIISFMTKYKYTDIDRVAVICRELRKQVGLSDDVLQVGLSDDVLNEALLETLKLSDVKKSGELLWGSGCFPDLATMRPTLAKEFTEYFLANEDAYKSDPNPDYYASYLFKIAYYAETFHASGNELVTKEQLLNKFSTLAPRYKEEVIYGGTRLTGLLGYIARNYLTIDSERAAFMGKYVKYLSFEQNNRLGEYLKYKNSAADVDTIIETAEPHNVVNAKYNQLQIYDYYKMSNSLSRIILDYVKENPHYWATDNAFKFYFSKSEAYVSDSEKMKTLGLILENEGKSTPLVELLSNMEKSGWDKKTGFAEFTKKCDEASPVIKKPDYDIAQKILSNRNIAYVEPNVKKFLELYKGRIPGDIEYATTPMEMLSVRVFTHHRNLAWGTRQAAEIFKLTDAWAPRVKEPGYIWNALLEHTSTFSRSRLWTMSKMYKEILKNNPKRRFETSAISNLSLATAPEDEKNQDLFADYYKEMGRDVCLKYFAGMTVSSWSQEFAEKRFAHILTIYDMDFASVDEFGLELYGLLRSSAYLFSLADLTMLSEKLFSLSEKDRFINRNSERLLFSKIVKTEKTEDIEKYTSWYFNKISKRSPTTQFNCINEVILSEYHKFSPKFYQLVLIPKLNELLAVQPNCYCSVSITMLDHLNNIEKTNNPDWTPAIKQSVKVLKDNLWEGIFAKNLRYTPVDNRNLSAATVFRNILFEEIPTADNWENVIQGISKYMLMLSFQNRWHTIYKNYVETILNRLKKAEKNEVAYMFLNNLLEYSEDNTNLDMQKYITVEKAQLSIGIQNLIPVPKSDPTYDLYMASQYLQNGNEARAWQLSQPKLSLLSENWEKLDINYNAWVVEQMKKQRMLDEALKFCLTILVKEYDLDSESVAQIALVKGDIYQEMNNNAAAKIEYQGLVANKRYMNTPAGKQAKYRLIDIMIQTKEYGSAEAQLERLMDIGTIGEQADANYYFAKIAFDQGDAEVASNYLKQCFALVHGHVLGRLLEGELKLILPRGLQDPEVQVGRLDLQTVVIPGKTLTLKLQDSNLSIARGGKSIPVLVTTSSGDKESVDLFVGSNDTTLFIGSIQTALGNPKPGNLLLEVNGNDEVSYIIDPEFQKANKIDYPAKILEVKSDARLVASSGEILSEEEEERRDFQMRMAQAQGTKSMRFAGRNSKTIRPGSDIYVELTDYDQDVSSEKDKILLNIKTSSGDVLNDYAVWETSEHSGVFRGTIPTGIPFPLTNVSDKEEATDPNSVINVNKPASWKSLADGVKPKWFEVDTMNSHRFKEINIVCQDVDKIKTLSLYGALAQDNVLIAKYPEKASDIKGGLTVSVARGNDTNEGSIRRLLRYKTFKTYNVKQPVFDRANALKDLGDGYMVVSMRGSFFLPQARELKLKTTCSLDDARDIQGLRVTIDGEYLFGRPNTNKDYVQQTHDVFLNKGVHEIEWLSRSINKDVVLAIEYEKEDGSFAPLPAEWFSIENSEELAKELLPKGKITRTEDGFKALLDPPTRFRKFRWVFESFTSPIIEVNSISATDADGKKILPVEKDFTEAVNNRIVEVAPGDEITIEYQDVKRLDEDMPIKEVQLDSSFANASVTLQFERIKLTEDGKEYSVFSTAKRVRKGDQLMAIVTDYDEDKTDERDEVILNVKTSSGESLNMKLLETSILNNSEDHNHAGRFAQILKFGDVTGGNMIKIMPDDVVTVTYLDKENTNPGIPFERTYSLDIEERDNPTLTIYKTDVKLIEDHSAAALNKIRSIQQSGGRVDDIKIMKELITATEFSKDEKSQDLTVNVNAPLVFQISYPKMAKHADSVFNIGIISESEIRSAKREERVALTNQVPVYIRNLSQHAQSKGFPLKMSDISLFKNENMLERGLFTGIVRLQIGSPGDPVNQYIENASRDISTGNHIQQLDQEVDKHTVPTILVAGSDVVTVIVSNEKQEVLTTRRIRLLSDARVELLDSTYSVPVETIHLGQKFYIRVTDPDQDISDDNDIITINVKSESNDELNVVLRETLPHSGVFTGVLTPTFIEKDVSGKPIAPDKSDQLLRVNFGDTVNFEFTDNLSISSKDPLLVAVQGHIYKGSDGQIVSFTKSFKDPDMAVKTKFLMAEARFEVAKEYRKLKQTEEADNEIAEGKRILEEAMRDYPDTKLKAQGEFLLANLSQELEDYQEAIGRYSNVINNWPTSEYAIRSQLRKAISLEKLEKFDQAAEEYVKLTYLYPDSQYVADASIRMGNYYYKSKQYAVATQIFLKFQKNNPTHDLAPKSLFIAANCLIRIESDKEEQAKAINPNASGDYSQAIRTLELLLNEYKDDKDLSAEAMYWLADCFSKQKDYKRSYQTFKKLTWDYPETKWAKIARGRLTESRFMKYDEE